MADDLFKRLTDTNNPDNALGPILLAVGISIIVALIVIMISFGH